MGSDSIKRIGLFAIPLTGAIAASLGVVFLMQGGSAASSPVATPSVAVSQKAEAAFDPYANQKAASAALAQATPSQQVIVERQTILPAASGGIATVGVAGTVLTGPMASLNASSTPTDLGSSTVKTVVDAHSDSDTATPDRVAKADTASTATINVTTGYITIGTAYIKAASCSCMQ